jgi:hypothetical protein
MLADANYLVLHSTLTFPANSKNSFGACPAFICTSIMENSSRAYFPESYPKYKHMLPGKIQHEHSYS